MAGQRRRQRVSKIEEQLFSLFLFFFLFPFLRFLFRQPVSTPNLSRSTHRGCNSVRMRIAGGSVLREGCLTERLSKKELKMLTQI